uniref:DNA polymerase epsilon subunit 4 n=1 Tax=Malurus cyaneus samueli TaxID=2593467 RepID=A0A8C5U2X9_9PASS
RARPGLAGRGRPKSRAERAAGGAGPGFVPAGRLPLARVKALVKADPDVTLASQEAVFVLARATELFVETIAKDAYVYAQQGKRKTLQRKDLDNAIEAIDEFAFLEGEFLIDFSQIVWERQLNHGQSSLFLHLQ